MYFVLIFYKEITVNNLFFTVLTFVFLLSSCAEDGKAGKSILTSIADEEAGENCADGGIKIETGLDFNFNGTLEEEEVNSTKYVCDGEKGEPGSNGTDGVEGTSGSDGKDGENGDSCTVTDNGDGTKTITCEDGTSVIVSDGTDGEDGDSCTVTDNGDGTKTITCEDGTSAIVSDGTDGENGETGESGSDGVCAGNNAPLINSISMPAASPTKDTPFNITINTADLDVSDVLNYSLVVSDAKIVQNATENNKYTITPLNGTVYNLTVMVSDGCQIATKQIEFTAYIADADTLTDPITGKMWQLNKSGTNSNWATAKAYCDNLSLAGYTDWRMPTISEIRTTIKECPSTMTGGSCKVTDPDHLAYADYDGSCTCALDHSGKYSIFGDTDNLWSASFQSDDTSFVWVTNLHYANIGHYFTGGDNNKVRCIRN
jgi:hypothetical protein